MTLRVAIILLNWNGYDDTSDCIRSLSLIDHDNYEIVVVDNGSADGSPDRLAKEFPRVKLIRNKENLGFAEGNNVGIRYALASSFDYVLILNNDTIVEPDFLTILLNEAERSRDIGVTGPKIVYYDDPKIIWFGGGAINKYTNRNINIGLDEPDRGQFDGTKDAEFMTGCAMLVKTEALKKAGLFDLDFFNCMEDLDLSVRIREKGYRIVYVGSSLIKHKVSRAMGGRLSPFYMYYQIRNTLIYVKKHGCALWAFVPIFTLIWLRRLTYFLITFNIEGFRANFLAVVDFFNGNWGGGRGRQFLKA